jgi:hypothetical protein
LNAQCQDGSMRHVYSSTQLVVISRGNLRDIDHQRIRWTMQTRAGDRDRGWDATNTMEIMVCTRRCARWWDSWLWSKMLDSTARCQEPGVQRMEWCRKARYGCAKRDELLNLCCANGASRGTRGNITAPHIDCHLQLLETRVRDPARSPLLQRQRDKLPFANRTLAATVSAHNCQYNSRRHRLQ